MITLLVGLVLVFIGCVLFCIWPRKRRRFKGSSSTSLGYGDTWVDFPPSLWNDTSHRYHHKHEPVDSGHVEASDGPCFDGGCDGGAD